MANLSLAIPYLFITMFTFYLVQGYDINTNELGNRNRKLSQPHLSESATPLNSSLQAAAASAASGSDGGASTAASTGSYVVSSDNNIPHNSAVENDQQNQILNSSLQAASAAAGGGAAAAAASGSGPGSGSGSTSTSASGGGAASAAASGSPSYYPFPCFNGFSSSTGTFDSICDYDNIPHKQALGVPLKSAKQKESVPVSDTKEAFDHSVHFSYDRPKLDG